MRAEIDNASISSQGELVLGGGKVETEVNTRHQEISNAPPEEGTWAFLGFIWRRKWIVVILIAASAGLGYLRYSRATPVYQSSAEILVVRKNYGLPIPGVRADTTYDVTHEAMLRSPKIITHAVEKLDLDKVPSLKASGNPVSRIIGGLGVSARTGRNGDLITFTYSSAERAECPHVLQAVIDAYQAFLGETQRNVGQETLSLISQAQNQLGTDLSKLEEEYRKFRDQAPLL